MALSTSRRTVLGLKVPEPSSTTPQLQATAPASSTATDPIAWIKAYQAANPANLANYERMFTEAEKAGIKLVRPTHAGGTKNSNDKVGIVGDGQYYPLFDIISNEGGPGSNWQFNEDGYWGADGKPYSGPNGEPPGGNGAHQAGGARTRPDGSPVLGHATSRTPDLSMGTSYGAAAEAARLQRQRSGRLGRSTTILGGFARAGAPATRITTLGAR